MKNARQSKILELIEEYEISTQEALIQRLSEHGFVKRGAWRIGLFKVAETALFRKTAR